MFYNLQDNDEIRRLKVKPDGLVKNYDYIFSEYLSKIHKALGGDDGYANLKTLADKLKHIRKEAYSKYVEDLMYPEKAIQAKIPTAVPFPTASFRMHNTTTISTNALGNFALAWNPFYLANSGTSLFFVNNNVSLDGSANNNNFVAVPVGFNAIPSLYAEYRLVSASIVITCKSSNLNLSGNFSGGIILDPSLLTALSMQVFGNFLNVDDSYYNQVVLANEGLRMLYFPSDPTSEQFQQINAAKLGFIFCAYGQSLQPSAACVRVDFYANFEATPLADLMQYIPRSMPNYCNEEQRYKAVKELQKNVVQTPMNANSNYNKKDDDNTILAGVEEVANTIEKVADITKDISETKKKFEEFIRGIYSNKDNNSYSNRLDMAQEGVTKVANLATSTLGTIFGGK